MKLVIVESPSKTHTLKRYLGSEYEIEASKGHVRDLAITGPNGYGVDVENDFKATYDSSSITAHRHRSGEKAVFSKIVKNASPSPKASCQSARRAGSCSVLG